MLPNFATQNVIKNIQDNRKFSLKLKKFLLMQQTHHNQVKFKSIFNRKTIAGCRKRDEFLKSWNETLTGRQCVASSALKKSITFATSCLVKYFNVYFEAISIYFVVDRAGEWLQVDLSTPMKVTGVITQGGRDFGQWITSFNVSYGNASCCLATIQDENRTNMVYL